MSFANSQLSLINKSKPYPDNFVFLLLLTFHRLFLSLLFLIVCNFPVPFVYLPFCLSISVSIRLCLSVCLSLTLLSLSLSLSLSFSYLSIYLSLPDSLSLSSFSIYSLKLYISDFFSSDFLYSSSFFLCLSNPPRPSH